MVRTPVQTNHMCDCPNRLHIDVVGTAWPSHGNESLPVGGHFPCHAKCHQKLVVNRSGILVEERAADFLNATFTVFVKELGSVCFWGELGLGTIGDWQHLYGERRFLNRRGCLNLMRRFSM